MPYNYAKGRFSGRGRKSDKVRNKYLRETDHCIYIIEKELSPSILKAMFDQGYYVFQDKEHRWYFLK